MFSATWAGGTMTNLTEGGVNVTGTLNVLEACRRLAITGGPSQEQLMPIPDDMKHLIDSHAMISLFATWALQLAGFISVVSLVLLYWRGKSPKWLYWVLMVVLLLATYMMGWCASLGGEIVHLEIRGHQILPAPEL